MQACSLEQVVYGNAKEGTYGCIIIELHLGEFWVTLIVGAGGGAREWGKGAYLSFEALYAICWRCYGAKVQGVQVHVVGDAVALAGEIQKDWITKRCCIRALK